MKKKDQQQTVHPQQSGDNPKEPRVLIYSDPGRTSMLVRKLLAKENQGWREEVELAHQQKLVPLRSDATLDLDEVMKWVEDDEADITLVVTEIPRMAGPRPKTIELHYQQKLAIISLPALGPVAVVHSLRRELQRALVALRHESIEQAQEQGGLSCRVERQKGEDTVYVTQRPWWPGRTWATLGMVAANEPLWALPKLTGVFSAAAATGAFGVFFSTIWEMATFLPTWRLILVSLIAVSIVVLWLITANGLWDKPGSVGGKREALMYNLSTLLSIVFSVSVLYLGLFLGILGMATLLIDPDFMTDSIGEDARFSHYVDIAWLSAAMGTVAGAIGSNFDDNTDLRNLTQGSREAQRYPRDDAQE